MALKILIVEDDSRLLKFFTKSLQSEGYQVFPTSSAEEAFSQLQKERVDLVLSDVALKGRPGTDLCREIRSRPETAYMPIILISGTRVDDDDQVDGFDAGADDYLLKPVSAKLLVAKIQSVLRRYQSPKDLAEILKAHGLALDVPARVATLNGQPVSLTRKEFDLLTAFLRQPGQVLSSDYLLEWVWGVDPRIELDTRTLTVHISSLRNKLGGPLGNRIVNVPRLGYRFEN